jgi:phosphomevalonate kinase
MRSNKVPKQCLEVRVPGKLLIAGEYAVLEPHAPAVVVAVSRYIRIRITPAPVGLFDAPSLGILAYEWRATAEAVAFEREDDRLSFVTAALNQVRRYLTMQNKALQNCHIVIESDLQDANGLKYGLGSSAAVVSAVVAGMLIWHQEPDDHPPDATIIFKLAALAHLATQGSGSGVDLAASCFGGWLRYSSFHPAWLQERVDWPLPELLKSPWPFLSVERLSPIPKDLRLMAAWSGTSVKTSAMIEAVVAVRESNPTAYERFLHDSRISVEHLVAGLQSANPGRILAAIERNRQALLRLSEAAAVRIETPVLQRLHALAVEAGGSGKPSGAGGGDCGIAVIFGEREAAALAEAWRQGGVLPLPLSVSDAGVTVSRIDW